MFSLKNQNPPPLTHHPSLPPTSPLASSFSGRHSLQKAQVPHLLLSPGHRRHRQSPDISYQDLVQPASPIHAPKPRDLQAAGFLTLVGAARGPNFSQIIYILLHDPSPSGIRYTYVFKALHLDSSFLGGSLNQVTSAP